MYVFHWAEWLEKTWAKSDSIFFFKLQLRRVLEKKVLIPTLWSQVCFYSGFQGFFQWFWIKITNKQYFSKKFIREHCTALAQLLLGRRDWTATFTSSPVVDLMSLSGTYCVLAYNMKTTNRSSPQKNRYDLVKWTISVSFNYTSVFHYLINS